MEAEEAGQWAELGKGYIRIEIFIYRTDLSPDSREHICDIDEDRAVRRLYGKPWVFRPTLVPFLL